MPANQKRRGRVKPLVTAAAAASVKEPVETQEPDIRNKEIVLCPTRNPYCKDVKLIPVGRKRSFMTNFSPSSMEPRPLQT